MSPLAPASLAVLLARALAELDHDRSVFGLPGRSFWRTRDGLDLRSDVAGGRVGNPLGPAAGPHTQLAHNIVVTWLAGGRTIELKTVQVLDRLTIPRPCIDAPHEAYNVEWSQELALDESLEQYQAAWILVHALGARGLVDPDACAGTRFEASVGYDLAGIRSDPVARFLDGLTDAGAAIRELRDRLPAGLRAAADVETPSRVIDAVTLSTFHGCPPDEIERIVEHLFRRHALPVVVKLNPTLLGREAVTALLHDRLGYRDIAPDPAAFERDLDWGEAVSLLARLADMGRRAGTGLGVKLSNTLVVRNTRGRLAGEVAYLSGPPLHPIAVALADRLARATDGTIPMSFSGGACAENFPALVACGFSPVTTCTDLLQPTGYRRLPRYLKALEAELERTGARTLDAYRLALAGAPRPGGPTPDAGAARAAEPGAPDAARRLLADYASRVADDPRYHADRREPAPTRRPPLRLLDCASCNNCTLVCPNGAFFSLAIPPQRIETPDLVVERGVVGTRPAAFEIARERQWALYDGFCNDCGNCDTWCPEHGGPHRFKPRFFDSRDRYEAASPGDGILVDADGSIAARIGGIEHRLSRRGSGWTFGDGVIEATLDDEHAFVEARAAAGVQAHVLPLGRYHALRLLREAMLRQTQPASAARTRDGAPQGGQAPLEDPP